MPGWESPDVWGDLSPGEGQLASFSVKLDDDNRDLVADLDDLLWGFHGCRCELSKVDQSLDPVGNLNEGAEWDQLGDLPMQGLAHRNAVCDGLGGVRLRRSQGQSCPLIRAALHPYPQPLLLATKVGMVRPAPNVWRPLGRREYLRAAVEASLRRLGTERIDLCYLHRVDPTVPLVDQVGELAALRQEGKVAEVGLSKVTPEQIQEASKVVPVAAVQNCLNVAEPNDPAVAYRQNHGIPYVPYRPLNAGQLDPAKTLRWLLDLGPHVAPIPGTADPEHLLGLYASAS